MKTVFTVQRHIGMLYNIKAVLLDCRLGIVSYDYRLGGRVVLILVYWFILEYIVT